MELGEKMEDLAGFGMPVPFYLIFNNKIPFNSKDPVSDKIRGLLVKSIEGKLHINIRISLIEELARGALK